MYEYRGYFILFNEGRAGYIRNLWQHSSIILHQLFSNHAGPAT